MKKAKKLFALALSIVLAFGCVSISNAAADTADIAINDKAVFIAEYADGRFEPERTITKVEAVALLLPIIADENGNTVDEVIPQYVNTANAYDNCHLIKITVK